MMTEPITVTALNQYVKGLMDRDRLLSQVLVRSEISNYKVYPSGHHYFSLKDAESSVRCVMFRREASSLRFRPESGMKVVVSGRVSVFPRDGAYQLYCQTMFPDGVGELAYAFEQLKSRLHKEGLFDPVKKQPLPAYPTTIALITSPAGAAVRDMIRILGARWPMSKVIVVPVRVQGAEAPEEICQALDLVNALEAADLIITGRGGGSMEDLWAFNEEIVAQAIYECRTPVISAVGHETDVTIADYVADLRAPTPSAAAELAVYDVRLVLEELYGYKDRLARCILAQVDAGREHLDFTEKRLRYLNPENQMVQKRQYLIDIEERLFRNMKDQLQKKKQMMSLLAARLDAKSPLKRLAGGYAYVTDEAGRMVDSAKSLQVNDVLMMTFSDGVVKSEVREVVEEEKA